MPGKFNLPFPPRPARVGVGGYRYWCPSKGCGEGVNWATSPAGSENSSWTRWLLRTDDIPVQMIWPRHHHHHHHHAKDRGYHWFVLFATSMASLEFIYMVLRHSTLEYPCLPRAAWLQMTLELRQLVFRRPTKPDPVCRAAFFGGGGDSSCKGRSSKKVGSLTLPI